MSSKSFETVRWLSKKGLKFTPIEGRQSFKVDGVMKYWGGLTLEVNGQGEKLIDSMVKIIKKNGIKIQYDSAATDLIYEDNIVKEIILIVSFEETYEEEIVHSEALFISIALHQKQFETSWAWNGMYADIEKAFL